MPEIRGAVSNSLPEPEPSADAHIVQRFSAGEASAFDELVARHQQRVARLAQRLLGWPQDVEDVVQDVFLAALGNLKKFRGDCSLATWLTTITLNKCRSRRRKRFLRWRFLRRKESETVATDRAPQTTAEMETLERVRGAVQALPARYREVVVLHYLEEMPVAEVGDVLGISRGAAEVRLHRARARLKTLLAPFGEK